MIYEQSDFHKPCEIQFSDSNLTASRMISAWSKANGGRVESGNHWALAASSWPFMGTGESIKAR